MLSVVPKALVEMSRTRMRETFAAIMVKRIYTLDFERSTVVKPSMSKSLENAAINRGVVVCTPTTLKSIMLSYVETLQHLKECHTSGLKSKLLEYSSQAEELQKILNLFNDGIMLLDEVDLILHPLKSELNFPIGEKFDLDGSNEGERWNLPIHLFDAFLYCSTGKISSFEQSGAALDLLKQMSSVIQQGIAERSLQRLPHIILLNNGKSSFLYLAYKIVKSSALFILFCRVLSRAAEANHGELDLPVVTKAASARHRSC